MKQLVCLTCAILVSAPSATAGEKAPAPLLKGLKEPASATVGLDGRTYVTVGGTDDRPDEGAVMVLDKGKAVPFATGLARPTGIVAHQGVLFVADRDRIWRIDRKGKAKVLATLANLPGPLGDLTVDIESGVLYTSVPRGGEQSAIYRIS